MSHLSVTYQVDYNIFAEGLAILSSILKHLSNIFHTISVNVENRGINAFSNISAVSSRSSFIRSSCKSDLIVNDNVNSSSYIVILKRLHLECLLDNSLASKGSISMNLDRYNTSSVDFRSTKEMLLSASSSTNDRVNSLKMRRVSKDSNLDFFTRFTVGTLQGCSKMIFDISSSGEAFFTLLFRASSLEFSHNLFHRLSNDISEDIKSTSVRHSNNESFSS